MSITSVFYADNFRAFFKEYMWLIKARQNEIRTQGLNHLCLELTSSDLQPDGSTRYWFRLQLVHIDNIKHYARLPTHHGFLLRADLLKNKKIGCKSEVQLVHYECEPRRQGYWESETITGEFKDLLEVYFNMIKNQDYNFDNMGKTW